MVREAAQILLDAHIKLKHLPVQPTPTTIDTLATVAASPGILPKASEDILVSQTAATDTTKVYQKPTDLPKHSENESVNNQADDASNASKATNGDSNTEQLVKDFGTYIEPRPETWLPCQRQRKKLKMM